MIYWKISSEEHLTWKGKYQNNIITLYKNLWFLVLLKNASVVIYDNIHQSCNPTPLVTNKRAHQKPINSKNDIAQLSDTLTSFDFLQKLINQSLYLMIMSCTVIILHLLTAQTKIFHSTQFYDDFFIYLEYGSKVSGKCILDRPNALLVIFVKLQLYLSVFLYMHVLCKYFIVKLFVSDWWLAAI